MNSIYELSNPEMACPEIAKELSNKNVALFLGAGISLAFGFPNWIKLANAIRSKAGLNGVDNNSLSTKEIQNCIDEALDILGWNEDSKITLVKELLYTNYPGLTTEKVFDYPLLIALSLLLTRYVNTVVTLNYDGMLEWFMSLFGIHVQSITSMPEKKKEADIRIYHPHGFTPHPKMKGSSSSDFIILGRKDSMQKFGGRDNLWKEKVLSIVEQHTCLFIGLSFNAFEDPIVEAPITAASTEIGGRILGYWLLLDNLIEEDRKKFERNSIVPLLFKMPKDIPNYILKICQEVVKQKHNNY